MSETINLFNLGCLINPTIGMWSGRKILNKKDLLNVGLDPNKLPSDIVNYGRKLLVSREELQKMARIEQRARRAIVQYSVPFNIANAHFVPIKHLPSIEASLIEFKKEFFEAVDSFISRFEAIKGEVQKQHPEFYERCLKQYYPSSPQMLRNKFHFSWSIFKIAGFDNLKETTVEELMASEELKNEKKSLLRDKMKEEVEDFVQQYVISMRAETIKFCDFMSARLNGKPYGDEEEGRKLTGRTISYLRKHIDKFSDMNIFDDNQIEDMLKEFKDQFLDSTITPSDFDNDKVRNAVTTALVNLRNVTAAEDSGMSEFLNNLKRKIVI